MNEYSYVTLRQKPELKEAAAAWFHDKWGVPREAYLECMEAYLNNETEYGWYLFITEKTLHQMYVRYILKKNIVARELRDNYLI